MINYEKQLLGGIIKTPYLIDTVATKLYPEDFSTPALKLIYSKALEVYSNKGFFDFFTLMECFSGDDATTSAMRELGTYGKEFEKEEVFQYIAQIKEQKKIIALKNIGASLTNSKNYANQKIDTMVTSVARQLFTLSESQLETDVSPEQVTDSMKEEIELYKGKELWGFSTGYKTLDRLSRGFQGGQVWVIGAYTSVGKSWFCLNLANNALKDGAKVLYLSTEMVEKRLAWRLTAINTGISEFDMINDRLSPESRIKRDNEIESLKSKKLRFISGVTKADEVVFYTKREIAKESCDIVFVDFLQNLAAGKSEYEELSDAVRRLQSLAIREKVCIAIASQVNRESNKTSAGGTFGYKGSGTIEACADIGILLKKDKDDDNGISVDVKKNRNGTGMDIPMETDFTIGRIREYV